MARGAARQRPANARAVGDGLKLHRRVLRLAGREYTVIGLRPGTAVRFSTNRFHDTWHVLSDQRGARLLARLMWGLAHQSRPGTLVLVDRPFLVPTPFDADPADPFVIVPGWHTALDRRAARALAARLPLRSAPDGTVRWRTHGLDAARADRRPFWERHPDHRSGPDRSRVTRMPGGLISFLAHRPDQLRRWAESIDRLRVTNARGMDYCYLGPWEYGPPGEVQIFRTFRRDVGVARRARADVLARPHPPADPFERRVRIWRQCGAIERGRDKSIANCRNLDPGSAERLALIGIETLDDLAERGVVQAWLDLRDAGAPDLDHALLWAMEGALTDTDRRALPPERRQELLSELKRAERDRRRRSHRPAPRPS
ncbi:TfoX/Sxy family DNA transformation protein [Thermomonospora catenispora]|uniref:TfoX/Sxy family DNA transformation protein n=1 Tax=Thermomonospora catenispora TaxID=2493090 RepID=UPI00112426B5|nr:TfoX/Sxy family DNA transformation protein [Thermomonospora catenispora]TNY37411.1 hypothetical protein EIO00_08090 [Thermomonospora catenispora]